MNKSISMQIKKPSKKIIILLVSCFVVILAIAILKYNASLAPNTKTTSPAASVQNQIIDGTGATRNIDDISTIDTDGDGLPDWQESLAGTDINKQDTDNDGTSDGSEIKFGRDPLKAGPDDQTDEKLLGDPDNPSGDATSVSDAVARKIFSTLAYVSGDTPLTEESQQNIINDVLSQIQTSFTYKEYPLSGITTIDKETPQNLRFYGDIVASLQVKMILDMGKNVSKIQQDYSILADIYQKQADDLYTIKVPKELVSTHLDVVNNFSKSASVYMAIYNEKENPLTLPFAVSTYQQATSDQQTALGKIARFLKNNDILFTSEEAGGYWNLFE